jgi:hypothetical protein
MALVGSMAGCLSFALFGFFGFPFGCGSFWAVWIGFSLGSRVFFGLLVGLPRYTFLCTWRRFVLF